MSNPFPPPLSPSTAAFMPVYSKKRGRSPEREASDGERTSRDKRFASRASTQGEQLAGELGLTRLKARGVEVTFQELRAQIGPKTEDALFGLLAACDIRNEELDQPLKVAVREREPHERERAAHVLDRAEHREGAVVVQRVERAA